MKNEENRNAIEEYQTEELVDVAVRSILHSSFFILHFLPSGGRHH
jgi:hypothetical protein